MNDEPNYPSDLDFLHYQALQNLILERENLYIDIEEFAKQQPKTQTQTLCAAPFFGGCQSSSHHIHRHVINFLNGGGRTDVSPRSSLFSLRQIANVRRLLRLCQCTVTIECMHGTCYCKSGYQSCLRTLVCEQAPDRLENLCPIISGSPGVLI